MARTRLRRGGAEQIRWDWLGSPDASIRLAGHSHRVAYRDSIPALPEDLRPQVAVLDLAGRSLPAPGVFLPGPNADYWRTAAAVPTGTTTVLVWDGNQHNSRFLLTDVPFTVVGRRGRPAQLESRVVPYRMMHALFERDLSGLSPLLTSCSDLGSVLVVGTPPPKPEHKIREGLANDILLRQSFFVKLMDDLNLTPESAPVLSVSTRVALWEALQESLEALAKRAGARFLPVVSSVQNADGTLGEEYCEVDTTHANVAYGALMWQAILADVGG
jgi:hypothetical protein